MNNSPVALQALQDRLDFVGLDESGRTTLRGLQKTIGSSIGTALDAFYEKASRNAHTRSFFTDPALIASAKARQEKHWKSISDARYDANYLTAISTVGRMHARLELEPRWYIGGYSVIIDNLIQKIVEKEWPSRFGRRGSKTLANQVAVVVKAALIDVDLGVSVYLEALDADRKLAQERNKDGDAQRLVVDQLSEGLGGLAEGNLTVRLLSAFPAQFEPIRQKFNASVETLETTIASVVGSVGSIRTGLREINVASSDLSQRTEQQAASLEETVAALSQVMRGVNETAEAAGQAQGTAATALKNAEKGGSIVAEAIVAMGQIERSSDKIGKIIGVIDEIAFQTNLLALNAGVEAARAGEAGRGFAVVAQEVRGLAQRSAEAAKEIKDLISTSSAQVEHGVELVSASGRSLDEIVTGVADMARVVSEIARSAREQAVSLKEVSTAADQMDKVTQQNAAMVEETTSAAQSLTGETQELSDLTERFHTNVPAAATAVRARAARPTPTPRPSPASRPVPQMRATGAGGAARKTEAQKDDWMEF